VGLVALFALEHPLLAQTLAFDTLPAEPGVSGMSLLIAANGGSRTLAGATFNAAPNADWEIVGNAFKAPYSGDVFAASHSGLYSLAGNAFAGMDVFGNVFSGLTINTPQILSSLYVGFDDNGNRSNDADGLTITAFGAGGDLASTTVALTAQALTPMNTAGSFAGLAGVTGYRFTTSAADALDAAYGRAYVIADDLTFVAAVPEASTWACALLGLALLVRQARRRPPIGRIIERKTT
jgi:hypothetical protein